MCKSLVQLAVKQGAASGVCDGRGFDYVSPINSSRRRTAHSHAESHSSRTDRVVYARKSERQWPAVDTEVDRAGGSRKYVLDVVGHRIGRVAATAVLTARLTPTSRAADDACWRREKGRKRLFWALVEILHSYV